MLNEQQNDCREFKSELVTVVEALSVLQDFVESVFGSKYHNFVACNVSGGDQNGGPKNNDAENPLTALKRLRWKHSKNRGSTDEGTSSSSPSDGDKESRVDNGYSSSGGVVLEEERRNSSSSSVSNQMSSPTTTSGMMGYPVKVEQKEDEESESTFSVSVGRPEVVSIKCEQLDDTDFLDDVDPFGTDPGSYHYEGDDSEITIENCYALSMPVSRSHAQNEGSGRPNQDNSLVTNTSTNNPPPPVSRYIPELIPIQSDPLTQPPSLEPSIILKEDDESVSSSDNDNSDDEWRPSSSLFDNTTFIKKEKPKRNISAISSTAPINRFSLPSLNFNPTFALTPSGGTAQRQLISQKSQLVAQQFTNGPTFKCDMCPATYKQEDSLRSHQKYKHNPSRVQCTCHLCGKSMVDKYRLQRHLRLHTGEKPFECQYCGQSFYRKDYHTKHLQRKHGISYNPPISSNAKAQFPKKPKLSSSSVSSSSSSSISTTTYKSYLSNVFETPSPSPTQVTSTLIHQSPVSSSQIHEATRQRHNFIPTSSTASTTASTKINDMTIHSNYNESIEMENLGGCNPHPLDYGGGGGEYGAMGNLMSMTSLTFEDLISADL